VGIRICSVTIKRKIVVKIVNLITSVLDVAVRVSGVDVSAGFSAC
jgi:hypothetical protein